MSGFDSIEIAGSADVDVFFGEEVSVVVETDDNILPLIETNVRGSTLVIRTRPGTNISPHSGIRVTVTMPSLESASITGSSNITVDGLEGTSVAFNISGSRNINASGSVESVDVVIRGSGNVLIGDLTADTATVEIPGSGNVTVYAGESLSVTISGSGTVQYRGNPRDVNTRVTGSGSIEPMP